MERTELLDLMGHLKLYGMKAAFDEVMATAVKRQHEPQRIIGDLLQAEISEKQARSIKYQLTIARLPLAKDLPDFDFASTPINETLVRELADGGFLAQQRNTVLVGGTGTGKTHLAIAIARSCIRAGARGRFYNVVDLVNRLELEARSGHQGRLADQLTRLDFIVLDELAPDNIHGRSFARDAVVSRTWGTPVIGERFEAKPPADAIPAEEAAQIMLAGVAKQQGIIVLPESARGHWLTYCQTPEASEKLLMELARQRREAYQTKGTFY